MIRTVWRASAPKEYRLYPLGAKGLQTVLDMSFGIAVAFLCKEDALI